jgi:hypothetical protein
MLPRIGLMRALNRHVERVPPAIRRRAALMPAGKPNGQRPARPRRRCEMGAATRTSAKLHNKGDDTVNRQERRAAEAQTRKSLTDYDATYRRAFKKVNAREIGEGWMRGAAAEADGIKGNDPASADRASSATERLRYRAERRLTLAKYHSQGALWLGRPERCVNSRLRAHAPWQHRRLPRLTQSHIVLSGDWSVRHRRKRQVIRFSIRDGCTIANYRSAANCAVWRPPFIALS